MRQVDKAKYARPMRDLPGALMTVTDARRHGREY